MSQQGATLQNYNNELVKCAQPRLSPVACEPCARIAVAIERAPARQSTPRSSLLVQPLTCCAWPLLSSTGIEELREKREEVNRSIAKDEEEKGTQKCTLCRALCPSARTPARRPHTRR